MAELRRPEQAYKLRSKFGWDHELTMDAADSLWNSRSSTGKGHCMTILGAALRAELAEALGLDAFRKDLRADVREIARELRVLRAGVLKALRRTSATRRGRLEGSTTPSAQQIRAARQQLGDSRKAFAARLRVSTGIVFAWETGRSVPRRSAIVARLRRLLSAPLPIPSDNGRGDGRAKRVLKLSPKRRATLRLQGQYMGYLRSLGRSQQAQVKKVRASSGFPAAIALARKLKRP
jgi:DNA-binding transcriptional regulator YiaG